MFLFTPKTDIYATKGNIIKSSPRHGSKTEGKTQLALDAYSSVTPGLTRDSFPVAWTVVSVYCGFSTRSRGPTVLLSRSSWNISSRSFGLFQYIVAGGNR